MKSCGPVRAKDLLLGGRVLSGAEAADWGLVTAAGAADEVDDQAERVARMLAARPANAYAEIRALLANADARNLRQALQAEHDAMLRTAGTDEARELIARFGAAGPTDRRSAI
jgi:2-(1,2-epoxy-1,2-dihydrophenyl)acetyl-CoA isomerase